MISPPEKNRFFELKQAEIIIPNTLAIDIFYDLKVIAGIAKHGDDKLNSVVAIGKS